MIKVAICGKLRSGKSMVASYLFTNYDLETIAFSDTLKYYAKRIYALTPLPEGKPRALFQTFGQACREFDPDVWIRHVAYKCELLADRKSTKGVVISDLRQPNEYEWARANGFTIVRVTAPDELRLARARKAGDNFTESDLAHSTEQWVDKFDVDFEIVNDGLLDELWAKVDDVMAKIYSS